MSSYVTAYNSGDTAVVIDGSGHLLGGYEFGSVNTNAREAKHLIDTDVLQVVEDPGGDLSGLREDAAEAMRATREANGDSEKPAKQSARAGTAKASDKSGENA